MGAANVVQLRNLSFSYETVLVVMDHIVVLWVCKTSSFGFFKNKMRVWFA